MGRLNSIGELSDKVYDSNTSPPYSSYFENNRDYGSKKYCKYLSDIINLSIVNLAALDCYVTV